VKADLHVHSHHSGFAPHLPFLRARDCYSSPFDVYRIAKARGMDLVCLTDHDTIDGCLEFLDRYPDARDFIMAEEIECRVPDVPALRIHLGAVGITEEIHREVQRLRTNVVDAAMYLRQREVFFAVNHLLLLCGNDSSVERYMRTVLAIAPALEIHNGAALAAHNAFVSELATECRRSGRHMAITGGSDAHTLQWVGTTYTETPSQTREEFLEHLRAGEATTGGRHGGSWRAMCEIYGVILNYWRALATSRPADLRGTSRLAASAFSIASLPFQFIPAGVAMSMKLREARRVSRYRRQWNGRQGLGRPEP
jgi:hypothetical protein